MTLAPGKVNLELRVGPRREDGYHELVTLLVTLGVGDELELESHPRVEVEVVGSTLRDTLVTHALELLAEASGGAGWRVRLHKRLPVGAGLGGGSSDAGCALRLANAMLERPLARGPLLELAAQVGSDVPFFAAGWRAAVAGGRGERLAPARVPSGLWAVVAWPGVQLSTAGVYAAYRSDPAAEPLDVVEARLLRNPGQLQVANDLGPVAETLCPGTAALRAELRDRGALETAVCGSGSAVFGLFRDPAAARRAEQGIPGAAWSACAPVGADGTVMA